MNHRPYSLLNVPAPAFPFIISENIEEGARRKDSETPSIGADAFIRGVTSGHSFRNSFILSNAEQFMMTVESTQFEQQVKTEMEEDGEIKAGLTTILRNAKGQYCRMALAVICAIFRGFELPALAFAYSMDAAYFDNPEHAPGRLITRLATDAPNVKAV
ncbi:hypothetical protein KIN20_005640 [Parelaphostrongylus tenuis]|uniref:Uncharacterized protein n=1 Tax=Parelaphostrongylus tenuis TaxID=148309 RepID=A0AAD5MJ16_PARTN|nr:hypothetical protein KIN20_005640 [Parelaphostrongylus tenuis]